MTEPHKTYRVWMDNWDAYTNPISIEDAIEHAESELSTACKAILITRGDLTLEDTLKQAKLLVELIEAINKDTVKQ